MPVHKEINGELHNIQRVHVELQREATFRARPLGSISCANHWNVIRSAQYLFHRYLEFLAITC